jgi:hypothetical protein
MTELDVECIVQRAREKFPDAKPRIISDNGPQFIARDFKEFVRVTGLTHVRTSRNYPQSNGKLERWHKTLKADAIRVKALADAEEARRVIAAFVSHYNAVRLHSAIGYVAPNDYLAGRETEIWAARDTKGGSSRWRVGRFSERAEIALDTRRRRAEARTSSMRAGCRRRGPGQARSGRAIGQARKSSGSWSRDMALTLRSAERRERAVCQLRTSKAGGKHPLPGSPGKSPDALRLDDGAVRVALPKFVKKELEGFLACGLLCWGFARLRMGPSRSISIRSPC